MMVILSIPQMAVSSKDIWPRLEKSRPSLLNLFCTLVLPLSLLPPLMLRYAGAHYGDAFIVGYGGKDWGSIAVFFFCAEMATFASMGWFIRQVAQVHKVAIDAHDAYMLASIAPIPLWLSSLALLVPDFSMNAGALLLALAVSCTLFYRGIYSIGHLREEMAAAAITQTVMGTSLAGWAVFLLSVLST